MIELRYFNNAEVDLFQAIASELSWFGFPADFTKKLLEKGQLLILLEWLG